MTEKPHRREMDKRLVKFDMTVNLPVIITLIVGFATMVSVVVQGYYQHEYRITKLEGSQASIEKGDVLMKQAIILEQIKQIDSGFAEQKRTTGERLDRIEEKIDRISERRGR